MKKYKITVNGTPYEIEIEEIDAAQIKQSSNKPSVKKEISAEPAQAANTHGNGKEITSPMPGTILSVNVTEGQTVKAGDILMILEAMKMENEILAPADGKISKVSVEKGATVEPGTVLCVIA